MAKKRRVTKKVDQPVEPIVEPIEEIKEEVKEVVPSLDDYQEKVEQPKKEVGKKEIVEQINNNLEELIVLVKQAKFPDHMQRGVLRKLTNIYRRINL